MASSTPLPSSNLYVASSLITGTAVEGKASTNEANIATNVTNIAANAKAIEDLDTELSSRIENLLEWGSF